LVVAGGVGANRRLREVLSVLTASRSGKTYFPAHEYCTDNGVMIAFAGALRLEAGLQDDDVSDVLARWSLEDLVKIPA
jgi:N6-L-threonylcarbamoyladenine synthase